MAAQPRFERGLDGPEPSGLPLADRAIRLNFTIYHLTNQFFLCQNTIMLTRKDLKEEIEIAVAHISQVLTKALATLATKEELAKVETRLENIETDVRDIKRDVRDLKADTPTAKEFQNHEKRITNLEKRSSLLN